jgi:3-deoxy-manno-octulosonate cytidylyltransferase (CMP-KDO synthetase)
METPVIANGPLGKPAKDESRRFAAGHYLPSPQRHCGTASHWLRSPPGKSEGSAVNPIVVIPARMASTRLPGKPLADIAGVPMIVRVWQQARRARVGPVLVAASDAEIVECVAGAGGRAVLTDPGLPSGSDRVHVALGLADREARHDAVINLQGDLPAVPPECLRKVARLLAESGADIATLAAPMLAEDEDNPNAVKAVVAWETAERGRALYFSRARVPGEAGPLLHHVGIYAFTRAALARFVALPPSPLELREKLEQLRALEAGMRIAVARVDAVPLSVDTEEDLALARRHFS